MTNLPPDNALAAVTEPASPAANPLVPALGRATVLALATGCELDLLDEEMLRDLDSGRVGRRDLFGYLADHWAPVIEILQSRLEDGSLVDDQTTTVITSVGDIGIVWTMNTGS